MDEAARDDEHTAMRVSIEAPWLGNAAECMLSGGLVLLRGTESEAALSLDPHTFQGRTGRLLRFCVPVDHLIFAGGKKVAWPRWKDFVKFSRHDEPGWDGSVKFSCHDERTAIVLSRRIWRLGSTRPWWQRWFWFTR